MPVNDELEAAREWRVKNAKGGRLDTSDVYFYSEDIVDDLLAKYASSRNRVAGAIQKDESAFILSKTSKSEVSRGRRKRTKTGQKRLLRKILNMDRLPMDALDAVVYLRKRFRTIVQIVEQSAKPYSPEWQKDGGGFIDWTQVDSETLIFFPRFRLNKSSLHRWFDLRVDQATLPLGFSHDK
jgi:hypothetical protein